MKHLSTMLLCSLFTYVTSAQTFPYNFSVDNGTYTPLQNAISVNNGQVWDDLDVNVPLGFAFDLFGESPEVLHMFGSTAYNIFGLPALETPLIISYGADLVNRGYETGNSVSPISYRTEGDPGSRIFKMEWANAGFFEDKTTNDFVNLQLWLYESTNVVEMHFGPSQVDSLDNFDYSGPLIGFMGSFSFATEGEFQDFWFLQGPTVDPAVSYLNTVEELDTLFYALNGTPGNGLIYRFSPISNSVGDPGQVDAGIRVYPSVTSDAFSIAVTDETAALEKDIRYAVLDPLGKTVRSGQVNEQLERVEVSGLPGGLYYVHLFSPDHSLTTKKIMKL